MEDQVQAVNMALLCNGPQDIFEGRRSSVVVHPTKGLAVSVFDNAPGSKSFYSLFSVNKKAEDNPLILASRIEFGSGKQPSVALVYEEESDTTYVIATRRCRFHKEFYYHIGTIDGLSIQWFYHTHIGSGGVKPRISASKNGTIALVCEVKYSPRQRLQYFIGNLDTSNNQPRISWKKENILVPGFYGVEPDIAISDTMIVIIGRKNFYTLQTLVGKITGERLDISWGSPQELTSMGINPTISINSHGFIVEVHQTKVLRSLSRNHGKINTQGNTIDWKQASTYTQGEYPTVSLSDDNFVFEMHKTNFGTKLFYSQGKLIAEEAAADHESKL